MGSPKFIEANRAGKKLLCGRYTIYLGRVERNGTTAWKCNAPKKKRGACAVAGEEKKVAKAVERNHLPPVGSLGAKVVHNRIRVDAAG